MCGWRLFSLSVACTGLLCRVSAEGRAWRAQWIASPDHEMQSWHSPDFPAPVFRKSFSLTGDLKNARLYICGLGYFHCRLDGMEVTDAELTPTPTQYDRRWRYRCFPVPKLEPGKHELVVEVGDGLYRCATPDSWHFDKATWMDYPKLLCELVDEKGNVVLKTDRSWEVRPGPTFHTAFRGGEYYDARLEDAGRWMTPKIVPGPGGVGEEETMPPCRILTRRKMNRIRPKGLSDKVIYDAGVCQSGVPRLTVRGPAGSKVSVYCGETLDAKGVARRIGWLVKHSPDFQRDVYILKGTGEETWRPRFTYHGYRFAEVSVEGGAELLGLEALEIGTDFSKIGSIRTSNQTLMTIERKAMQSIRANFVGYPTDCPHREKNGWSSEARLQSEALLYGFDAGTAYLHYTDTLCDTQRPDGHLSGIAPSSGWGYNWGAGPSWESCAFLIDESVWRFTGNGRGLAEHCGNLDRFLVFCETLVDERGLLQFGLGDWMAPDLAKPGNVSNKRFGASWAFPESTNCPYAYIQTAFFKRTLDLRAEIAARANDAPTAARCRARAAEVAAAIRATYGTTASTTGCALSLLFGLCHEEDRSKVAAELADIVRGLDCRVDFGTIGSGCVLRALFESGYADLGYRMMVQPKYPGYGYFAGRSDLTTFSEYWYGGADSQIHGAFTDVVACMYRYLAGMRHVARHPGRDFLEIRPMFPKGLDDFAATHDGYCVSWKRTGNAVTVEIVIPNDAAADYVKPDGSVTLLCSGKHSMKFCIEPPSVGR